MKVVFIIYSMSNGGAERVVANLANHWSRKGLDVSILTLSPEECFYHLEHDVKLLCVSGEGNGFLDSINRIFTIRKYIQMNSIDLGISFMTSSNVIFSLASIGLKLKKFGSERTYPPRHVISKKWNLLRKLTYRFLDCVIVQTVDSKNWFQQYIKTKNIEVIANPVSFPLLATNPNIIPYRKGKQKIILAVGRLVKSKGFASLIESFANYESSLPNHDLYIIGHGEQFELLNALIIKLKLESRVYLIGRVGNMSDWYRFSDIYVLSSEYEGFPNTLIEAMSFGLPAVAMNCYSGPSDILNKKNGVLVNDKDYKSLWFEVIKIAKNDKLHSSLAIEALNVNEEYSIELIADKWLKL